MCVPGTSKTSVPRFTNPLPGSASFPPQTGWQSEQKAGLVHQLRAAVKEHIVFAVHDSVRAFVDQRRVHYLQPRIESRGPGGRRDADSAALRASGFHRPHVRESPADGQCVLDRQRGARSGSLQRAVTREIEMGHCHRPGERDVSLSDTSRRAWNLSVAVLFGTMAGARLPAVFQSPAAAWM